MPGNKNSGPRPRPTAIKLLRGVTRRDRINRTEPAPPPADDAFDQPPPELEGDDIAIAEWRRIVPMLRKIGVVTTAERSALIALCQQWARYLNTTRELQTAGYTVENERGIGPSPLVMVADKALAHCQKLWMEFGLTPSARSKIHATPQDAPKVPDKWAGLLP